MAATRFGAISGPSLGPTGSILRAENSTPHQFAADDQPPDFRRAGADLQQFASAIEPIDLGLAHITGAAEDLHGMIHHARTALGSVENARRGELVNFTTAAAADFQVVGFGERAVAEGPHRLD